MRRIRFEVLVEIRAAADKLFCDMVGAAWGYTREEAVGPMERLGLGFVWYTGTREGAKLATLPAPWGVLRDALVKSRAIHPKAHVHMIRSEVVRVRKGERPRVIVEMERG